MKLLALLLACSAPEDPPDKAADRDTAPEACLPVVHAWADLDGDGFGDPRTELVDCGPPSGYVTTAGDCDDRRADVYPGAPEACDGVDHDCDGATMDVAAGGGWRDADGDGYGGEAVSGCPGSPGVVGVSGDCDDASASVHPGAGETCEGRGRDEDCDGLVDDADPDVVDADAWSPDGDGDGYGDPDGAVTLACDAPRGSVLDATDCDDTRADVHPWAAEPACTDGIDHDCDGVAIDADEDLDGWGDCDDCDVWDAAIHPEAAEVCDEIDNNCDGAVDEGLTVPTWYEDHDGDGYGDDAVSVTSCEQPERSAAVAGDCDDLLATVHPGARESCRTTYDDDCDGILNEVGATYCSYWYYDGDGDGDGVSTDRSCQCAAEAPWSATGSGDCDDGDASIHPDAEDVCRDGVDSDCDGRDACPEDDLPLVLTGDDSYDRLGDEVVLAPDLDADGWGDLAVAVPGAGAQGEVRFYQGPVGPSRPTRFARLTGSATATQQGIGSQLVFGDGDGDGIVDVYVGDGVYTSSSIGAHGMVARLSGPLPPDADVAAVAAGRAFGDSSGGSMGDAVAWAGDIEGDGEARLVLGDSRSAGWRNGVVYLLPVDFAGDLAAFDLPVAVTSNTTAYLGTELAAGEDLDGDGVPDLAVAVDSGTLVFFGPLGGTRADTTADLTVEGTRGYAYRAGDDVDDDGVADLLVLSAAGLELHAGLAAGRRGSGDATFVLVDGLLNDAAVDPPALADLDGDGVLDLAYGRPTDDSVDYNSGAIHVALGPLLGTRDVDDCEAWLGEQRYGSLGWGLQPLGDVDGDGRDDVLVSARSSPRLRTDQGALRLLLGAYVE